MVYSLTLSYNGALYAGWQRQPNAVAVQEVVERALERLLGQTVSVVAASRTDAGVHARGQVAHIRLARPFPCRGLVFGANHHLPGEIRVLAACRMRDDFHARRDAVAKEYRYRLSRSRVLTPLESGFTVPIDPRVDLDRMRAATKRLRGRHDFTAFARSGGSHRHPLRRIYEAHWQEDGDSLCFRIIGDGFLRGMARALVGTLIEVGRGRLSLAGLEALLQGGVRGDAGPTAPARGLVLEQVFYAPGRLKAP